MEETFEPHLLFTIFPKVLLTHEIVLFFILSSDDTKGKRTGFLIYAMKKSRISNVNNTLLIVTVRIKFSNMFPFQFLIFKVLFIWQSIFASSTCKIPFFPHLYLLMCTKIIQHIHCK